MPTRTCERSQRLLFTSTTRLWPGGFPFAGHRRLSEDLALINPVKRAFELRSGAGAHHVAAHLLQERELLRTGIERDEVNLYRAFALLKDVPRVALRRRSVRVLAVIHD